MSSLDSQVLSLGTMFTRDIVDHYGFGDRMSERQQVLVGRMFVGGILLATYFISLLVNRSIFKLGIWSFSGFAALLPIVVAALFWKDSTKHGVVASVLTVVASWIYFFYRGWSVPGYSVGDSGIIPTAVMLAASSLVLIGVSLVTRPPEREVLAKFFPRELES
jgi:SSS family solute:Na+ symporter